MQLLLDLDGRTQTLLEIHRRLTARFGTPGPFQPLDPVSQLVMGMIGGRTRGEVSKAAFRALLTRFGDWAAVRDAPIPEIEKTIGGVTYAEIKAPRLKTALAAITTSQGAPSLDGLEIMTVGDALARLERLRGVGRKAAAATLNFSTLRKITLVIDTHHLRVLHRLGWIGESCSIKQAYDRIVPILPPDWSACDVDDHHQLMKTLGQTTCRHDMPICRLCPLDDLCPMPDAGRGTRRAAQTLGSRRQAQGTAGKVRRLPFG